MHIPQHARKDPPSSSPIRLLLVGIPGSGKSYSTITTFPNPVVINVDNNCNNKDILASNAIFIDFFQPEIRKAISPLAFKPNKANVADSLVTWLRTEGVKLTSEQTLIIDSASTVGDGVAKDLWAICPVGKSGEPDGFWFYDAWAEWWCGLVTLLKESMACNVVLLMHEEEVRDKETGRVLQYKWILEGKKFSPRISQFFTDVFRASVLTKESGPADSPQVTRTFRWQVMPDDKFPFCKTRMKTSDKFVPATYKSFKEYAV